MGATASVEFPMLTLLLMALVVALGYGLIMTSLGEDLAIVRQLIQLR